MLRREKFGPGSSSRVFEDSPRSSKANSSSSVRRQNSQRFLVPPSVKDVNPESKRSISFVSRVNLDPVTTERANPSSQRKLIKLQDEYKSKKKLPVIGLKKGYPPPPSVSELTRKSIVMSNRHSYLAMEKKKLMKPNTAKISWEGLQNMKLNDIKGYFDASFEPSELLVDDFDQEDTEFLSDYKVNNNRRAIELKENSKKNHLQHYGAYENWGKIKEDLGIVPGRAPLYNVKNRIGELKRMQSAKNVRKIELSMK